MQSELPHFESGEVKRVVCEWDQEFARSICHIYPLLLLIWNVRFQAFKTVQHYIDRCSDLMIDWCKHDLLVVFDNLLLLKLFCIRYVSEYYKKRVNQAGACFLYSDGSNVQTLNICQEIFEQSWVFFSHFLYVQLQIQNLILNLFTCVFPQEILQSSWLLQVYLLGAILGSLQLAVLNRLFKNLFESVVDYLFFRVLKLVRRVHLQQVLSLEIDELYVELVRNDDSIRHVLQYLDQLLIGLRFFLLLEDVPHHDVVASLVENEQHTTESSGQNFRCVQLIKLFFKNYMENLQSEVDQHWSEVVRD